MKIHLVLIFGVLLSSSLYSVSAFHGKLNFTQNDGTVFQGNLRGDEWLHYISLPNEYVAIYNKEDKGYNYALIREDTLGHKILISSDIKVNENLHLNNPKELSKTVPPLDRLSLSKLHRNKPSAHKTKQKDNNDTKKPTILNTKSSIWKEVLKEKKEPTSTKTTQ
ncbi:hypothetical protein JHD50_09080 [Sulfurimonas sp. MAG313]|nr:hypothetical protein [Sulfurimonas sp. MAG313]MDF1881450.1 hypothetical protein [Sulfurimonas sp. MAG313]